MNDGQDVSRSSLQTQLGQLQIDFYHLRDSDLATPLAMLAHKTLASGHKLLIL